MPVYECARCNNLTYSASRFASIVCDVCGGARHRALEHAFSFDEAREEPRSLHRGDHCCVTFDAPADIAPLCTHIIRTGLADGARVIGYPPRSLREAVTTMLESHETDAVEWHASDDVYGTSFDADAVVAQFRDMAEAETRPVYVVGGAERPLSDLAPPDEFRRFERMATELAIETGMVVVCLYDRALQGDGHLEAAEETHPLASGDGAAIKRNERFVFAGAA